MTMLRPIVLPPYGGDTAWANAAAAYQRMGPDWRELADGLRALHSNNLAGRQALRAESAARSAGDAGQAPTDRPMQSRRDAAATPNKLYETEHPVVRVHPETGERALLLGAFAKTILGRPDSDRLITLFQKFVTALDNTVRWRWAPGDLGMWDNRSTQHCAIADYGSHQRLMHRITVLGDIPVGTDGRPSIAVHSPS
jgi:taurine dioxygenase